MAAGPIFDSVPIRNCNSKMAAFDSSYCSVEPGECYCKDLNTFPTINRDSNNDMGNNEDGISHENSLDETKDLRLIVERNHNVVKDLIMLEFYMAKTLLDDGVNEMAVKTSQLKPLKMMELHDNEDHITMDITTWKLGPFKARIPYFMQDQNWEMTTLTTYDSDLLPG